MESCQCAVCSHSSSLIAETFECLMTNTPKWNEDTTAMLANYGNLEGLKFVREHGCPWDFRTTANAASEGNLEMLIWCHQNGCKLTSKLYYDTAISDCHFRQSENSSPDFLFIPRSNQDYLACVKYAYNPSGMIGTSFPDGCDCEILETEPRILEQAAIGGNLDMFKFIYEKQKKHIQNNPNLYTEICLCIVSCQHFHKEDEITTLLKFAHEMGFLWNETIYENAAFNRHPLAFQYAYQNGCPWNENTLEYVYKSDAIDCLIYAYRENCPGREKYYNKIFEELLEINLAFFWGILRFKLFVIQWRKRYYIQKLMKKGNGETNRKNGKNNP